MVKSYSRYGHSKTFGIVVSPSSNSIWVPDPAITSKSSEKRSHGAGRAIVPANEEVLCWDLKKGELVSRWYDNACGAEVTSIVHSKVDPEVFAVGYADGSIRIWDSKIKTAIVTFNGHKAAVTSLCFDSSGARLASGGKDANCIIWDLVSETGLYRLKGHKDQVMKVEFLKHTKSEDVDGDVDVEEDTAEDDPWLLTTGKDGLIKLWDLSTQHCVETHMAHRGECWAMTLSPDQRGIITAGNEGELKIWTIDPQKLATRSTSAVENCLLEKGIIHRQNKDRANTVTFHPNGNYFAVNGPDKSVEIFRIRTEAEVEKVLKRKKKRKMEKAAEAGETVNGAATSDDISSAEASDVFVSHVVVRTGGKVRSVDWAPKKAKGDSLQILVACTNNSLEYYDIQKYSKEKKSEVPEYNRVHAIELPGHRSDVRALSLSSDDRMLASASNGSLKIWNVRTQTCIRTFECGYALCCSFLPGDKIVVVGTKTGELEMFDVASAAMIEQIKAHDGAIWSLQVHPDGKSVVTGSADKSVKFWEFKVVQEEIPGTTRTTPVLRLVHTRTIKLSDDVLSVRFTPNGKHIAAALLDNTVKILFTDTLKLFHNLYGHKLPVLNMDISSDSKLIATCSADKNVKIWGLDFGDCHKSFFAHQDSIMQVVFERNSHNFFSASKDKMIKYFDGDKFEQIQKLETHHGEIWAMVVGNTMDLIVSASHDKSIRTWETTGDEIFLEEEREKELEQLYESTLTSSLEDRDADGEDEVGQAGKQTMETLMDGEKIIEALDLAIEDLKAIEIYKEAKQSNPSLAPPQRNIMFMALGNISAEEHVLNTVKKIKAANLQDALLVLPFDRVMQLLTFINIWAGKEWHLSLTSRILFFLLKTHHRQIVATKTARPMLDSIRLNLREALKHQKDEMGYNLAALRYVKQGLKGLTERDLIDEDEIKEAEERGRKKRGFASLA